MKKIKLIEIDDNNKSTVIFNNTELFEAISVSTKEGEDAFTEASFEQMANDNHINIFDFGGGNDSRKGLEMLANFGGDDFLYIIPVMNSLAGSKNAIDTFQLINKSKQTLFILNNVQNKDEKEKEFLFWFGSAELDIPSIHEALGKPNFEIVEYSPILEISAMKGITVSELASFSHNFSGDAKTEIFKLSEGNKDKFKEIMSKYKQSLLAERFVNSNIPQIAKFVKKYKNIAVCSTKGGVGKTTLSAHILPACF